MSYYEEKLALFTQRLGVTSSELQNTLIEINWVKLNTQYGGSYVPVGEILFVWRWTLSVLQYLC